METIDIFIENKNELYEKYNKKIVSSELMQYITNRAMNVEKGKKIHLKIHLKENNYECIEVIKNGIKEEYQKNIRNRDTNNMKQILLLLVGIIVLIISTFINTDNILHEVIIIAGWVPIWESIDLELFTDAKEKRRRKILKKLMSAEIEII